MARVPEFLRGKPTDEEMNQIVYERGDVRFVVATACSVDNTAHDQFEEWDRQGRMTLALAATEVILPAIAAGIYVGSGGRERALIKLQNSGYGALVDPITSLMAPYGVPTGVWTTVRGVAEYDDSIPHRNVGRITDPMTRLWFNKESIFGRLDGKGLRPQLTKAMDRFAEGENAVIRVSPEGFDKVLPPSHVEPREYTQEGLRAHLEALDAVRESLIRVWGQTPISREEAHDQVMEMADDETVVVTGNGFDPRALFQRHHRPLNIYGVGNMGAAKGFAIGIKLANPFIKVFSLEGDQNAQQGHAALYNLARYNFSPNEYRSFVLDNGHGTSVGEAESLPLLLDDHRFSTIIRTVPEQAGEFKSVRVEKGLPKHGRHVHQVDEIEEIGPIKFQIQSAMAAVRQVTAREITRRVKAGTLREQDIPRAFANYRDYSF